MGVESRGYLLKLVNHNGILDVVIISANLLHANIFKNPETKRDVHSKQRFPNRTATMITKTINQPFKNISKPSTGLEINARKLAKCECF